MVFFLIVASVIGLLNYYVYATIAAGLPEWGVVAALVVCAMYASLFAAIFLERKGRLKLSLPFAWAGYGWLGFVTIFAFVAAVIDLSQLAFPWLDDRRALWMVAGLSVSAAVWGSYRARHPRLRVVRLTSPKLAAGAAPLRLLQISDLHLGDGPSLRQIKRLAKRIAELRPDVIVSTGDLFDGYLPLMQPFVEILRDLRPPLGKYAVVGNHEAYAGLDAAILLTEQAGFRVLRNQSVGLGESLSLAGVDDPAVPDGPQESSALADVDPQRYTVLLKHRPVFEMSSQGRFDLQLSGHTHGGQIFPFVLLTKLQYRAKVGLSQLAPKQMLYLSRGTGSWGPQMRWFAPTEITLFLLEGCNLAGLRSD